MKSILKIALSFSLVLNSFISFGQVAGDYRTIVGGTWTNIAIWEIYNGTAWVAASAFPTNADGAILVAHGVTIQANVTVDQVTVQLGIGQITTQGANVLTIANGTGVDLTVNGVFYEQSSASVAWVVGATWQYGTWGQLVRTTNTSSNNWQANYQGGASTMPATAQWQ